MEGSVSFFLVHDLSPKKASSKIAVEARAYSSLLLFSGGIDKLKLSQNVVHSATAAAATEELMKRLGLRGRGRPSRLAATRRPKGPR